MKPVSERRQTGARVSSKPPGDSLRSAARALFRAWTLRCPRCGSRGIFSGFLKLRQECPRCALPLERGESDHFYGAYMFNLIAVELLFGFVFLGVLIATWPTPPWKLLQYGGVALVVLGSVLAYPFAKTTWLAVDLLARPQRD